MFSPENGKLDFDVLPHIFYLKNTRKKKKEIAVRYIPPPDNNVADHQNPDWPL